MKTLSDLVDYRTNVVRFPSETPDEATLRRCRLAARQTGCINDEVDNVESHARWMMRVPGATADSVIDACRAYASQIVRLQVTK